MDAILAAHAAMRARVEAAPFAASIGSFLDEAAARHGQAPLWRFIDQPEGLPFRELTYTGLAELTTRIAAGLARAGVRKGERVGVMLPNIPAFPLTWLALARLGAIMIPVNTGYTVRELDYVLGDGGATHLVAYEDCLGPVEELLAQRPALPRGSIHVVGRPPQGMQDWMELTRCTDALPTDGPGLEDLVNLQYTSGTTGFPKGCMLTHRYWLTLARVAAGRGGEEVRCVLAAQPFYYMDPQWLLLMAMHLGGRLVVAPRPSATRFMDWVRREGVEYCIFPQVILKQPERPEDRQHRLKRVSIFGLRGDMHAALEKRFGCIARESFGMTEIGSGLTTPPEAAEMVGTGTCGLPSPFREASIRDMDGRELGPDEVGELWVRGPGILKGYWNKPEANAASFPGEGWFRTGDLFRRDARGFHYIVGRVKDMIRRSGENIAAREVEAVLLQLDEVQEAAVIPVPDADRGQEVKACLVLKPGLSPADLPPERIFAHCLAGLARFKVPRFLEYRDSLPKTPSEKIAKHVLVAERSDLREGAIDRLTTQPVKEQA